VSANCVELSGCGCIARVQEVVCGGQTGLLRCDLEIGVDCALATYSSVELVDSVCPMRGGSVKLLGRIMGSCPVLQYAPKQRLIHDFQLTTCVTTSVWLPLYALS